MAKLLAAVSLGTIALVLPTLGMSFGPVGTDVTKRDKTYEFDDQSPSEDGQTPNCWIAVVVKTTAIRSRALPGANSKPYAARPLTDCEPIISPLADARSGWRIRECST